jgi:hypothetical protein
VATNTSGIDHQPIISAATRLFVLFEMAGKGGFTLSGMAGHARSGETVKEGDEGAIAEAARSVFDGLVSGGHSR